MNEDMVFTTFISKAGKMKKYSMTIMQITQLLVNENMTLEKSYLSLRNIWKTIHDF